MPSGRHQNINWNYFPMRNIIKRIHRNTLQWILLLIHNVTFKKTHMKLSSSKGVSSYSNPNMLSYGSFPHLKDPSSETCMYTKSCYLVEYGINCDIYIYISSANDKDEQTIWHHTSTKQLFIKLPCVLNDFIQPWNSHGNSLNIFFTVVCLNIRSKDVCECSNCFFQGGRVNDIIEYDYDSYSIIPVIYLSIMSV